MPDRYEFTAPDGSSRWCSRELFELEKATQECKGPEDFGEYCQDCEMDRETSLAILKPQPTGFRWKRNRVGGWMLVRVTGRSEVLGHLFHHTMNGKRFWAAERYMRSSLNTTAIGTLSACAHALVDAVTDSRKPTGTASSSRTHRDKSDASQADR